MRELLFEGDYTGQASWRDAFRWTPPETPEKRLMIALLEDALFCLDPANLKTKATAADQVEAVAWFDEDDPGVFSRFYSFENICLTLGLDASALRTQIKKYGDKIKGGTRSHGVRGQNLRIRQRRWAA